MTLTARAAFVLALAAVALQPGLAFAYIGPGAGIAVGPLLVIGLFGLIAVVGLVLYPTRLILKKLRQSKEVDADADA